MRYNGKIILREVEITFSAYYTYEVETFHQPSHMELEVEELEINGVDVYELVMPHYEDDVTDLIFEHIKE